MDIKKGLEHAEAELLNLEQLKIDIERKMLAWIRIIEGLRTLNEGPGFEGVPAMEEFAIEQETPRACHQLGTR